MDRVSKQGGPHRSLCQGGSLAESLRWGGERGVGERALLVSYRCATRILQRFTNATLISAGAGA